VRQFADGREGVGGAKSYDGEKAWSSINYSILSGFLVTSDTDRMKPGVVSSRTFTRPT
jgi:hypothetical protein